LRLALLSHYSGRLVFLLADSVVFWHLNLSSYVS
jgi:hypothetical protein